MKKDVRKKIEKPRNPLLKRGFAYAIDWYVSWVICAIPVAVIWSIQTGQKEIITDLYGLGYPKDVVAFALCLLCGMLYYYVVPLVNGGQTLGKKLVGLKIVGLDGKPLDSKVLALRQIVMVMIIESSLGLVVTHISQMLSIYTFDSVGDIFSYIMLACFAISVILVCINGNALHDYVCKSKVIEIKKEGGIY